MKILKSFTILFGVLGLTVAACGGGNQGGGDAPPPVQGIDYPEWVDKGSVVGSDEAGKAFFGVSSASGIKNRALAMTTADNRARAEVGKTFEVYTASLMKDYMASTTAGDMSASSEEQHVEQAIKTFSAQTLSGIEIAGHWEHPDGTIYSLARLELGKFAGALDQMKGLNDKIRDYVRKNAEKAHMDLDKEVEKREGAE